MRIKYKIFDDEGLLEKDNFLSFLCCDIEINIQDGEEELTINSGLHNTFLFELLVGIPELFSKNEPFEVDAFETALYYTFELIGTDVIITTLDYSDEQFSEKTKFKSSSFYKLIKQFLQQYLQFLLDKNPKIEFYQEYKEFRERYKQKYL
jgi:hypothetical protein